jgi:hypothetical protein
MVRLAEAPLARRRLDVGCRMVPKAACLYAKRVDRRRILPISPREVQNEPCNTLPPWWAGGRRPVKKRRRPERINLLNLREGSGEGAPRPHAAGRTLHGLCPPTALSCPAGCLRSMGARYFGKCRLAEAPCPAAEIGGRHHPSGKTGTTPSLPRRPALPRQPPSQANCAVQGGSV